MQGGELGQLLFSGLLIGGVYALATIGLTLIFGVLRVINFAHGEFVMVGMYATFWIWQLTGLDPYASALIVVPLMFLFGAVIHLAVVRHTIDAPHVVQVFATFGLAIALQYTALFLFSG